jgi:hypothetical protein
MPNKFQRRLCHLRIPASATRSTAATKVDAATTELLRSDRPDEDRLLALFDCFDTTREWAPPCWSWRCRPRSRSSTSVASPNQ